MRVEIQGVHYNNLLINKIYYGSKLVFDRSIYKANQNVYVFDLRKVTNNYRLILQNVNGGTVTDWGDGTVDTGYIHNYSTQGVYTVKTRRIIDTNDINTSKSLTNVVNIDNTIIDYNYMFSDCINLINVPMSIPNGITDTYGMFLDCTSLTNAPSLPNTIVNCYGMFDGCIGLTTIPQQNINLMEAVKNGTNTTCTDYSTCYRGCTNISSPQNYATLYGLYNNWFI
jgi:hypothetical protein